MAIENIAGKDILPEFHGEYVDHGLTQVDKYGCITACMSNVVNGYTGANVIPAQVDGRIGRAPETPADVDAADFWLIEQGFQLRRIHHENQLLKRFVNDEIDAHSILAGESIEGMHDERNIILRYFTNARQLNAIRENHDRYKEQTERYEDLGWLVHDDYTPTVDDLRHWTATESAAVLGMEYTSGMSMPHYTLFFKDSQPGPPEENFVEIYYPTTDPSQAEARGSVIEADSLWWLDFTLGLTVVTPR